MSNTGEQVRWFVVLPDTDVAPARLTRLCSGADSVVRHESGRPWLVGCWSPEAVVVGDAGPRKVAVVGQHDALVKNLSRAAAGCESVATVDQAVSSVAGSYHAVASIDGEVRVQGSVTGLRRVYHACVDEVTVAADRADVLARCVGAEVDAASLALHLLSPTDLHPLGGRPVWRGIHYLPADHYLRVGRDGQHRMLRRWWPPQKQIPLSSGASAVTEALARAVQVRTRNRRLVSCDLGGVDSTSICCLAARSGANVAAFTADSRDGLAEDVLWARRTVQEMRNIEHHVISAERVPLMYAGIREQVPLDEPCPAAIDAERWLTVVRHARRRGSTMHMTGIGGDELFTGSPAYLHALLRSNPRVGMRQLRGFAVKYRWSWSQMARQLLDGRSYGQWLSAVGAQLTEHPPGRETPMLDWEHRPTLPSWATPAAVDSTRAAIWSVAHDAAPLAHARGQHQEMQMLQFASRVTRQLEQMAARLGVDIAAPYYDEPVVEAALAVCPDERVTPWQYKPLLAEAMRGIVPEASRLRATSDDGDCDVEPGLRRHRDQLLDLCEDSRLAALGLVDPAHLREALGRAMSWEEHDNDALRQTLACEVWLRNLDDNRLWEGGGADGAVVTIERVDHQH